MAKWFLAAKRAEFDEIGKKYGISPVLARIIRNRDIIEDADMERYLHGSLEDLYDGSLMQDMDRAVAIIKDKIREEKSIRIIGDYDVDGICSTYILKQGLMLCGGKVDAVIPHRVKDGYGINESLIEEAHKDNIDTIITCDNGIAAAKPLEYAASLGMTCVVTDHHEIPYEMEGEEKQFCLPPAAAVVDPKREDCSYPFKKICGAVVAWKFVLKLWEGVQINETKKRELLEFAGIATVCDIMELLDENRIIVKEALKSMANSANAGLRALIRVHDLNPAKLSAYHIGFVIGPCFNATGRLDSAEKTLELLECNNDREAIFLAAELKKMNESRKDMTEKAVDEAVQIVEEKEMWKDKVMVIYLPKCHESLAGIVAGRIKEKYARPTIVLTNGEECVKGSGRSIDAYSMYEELSKCKELFLKYGGHKLAAGLSLEEDKVEVLRKVLNENCTLTEEDMEEKIVIDVPMPLSFVTKDFLKQLELLEPFGVGNAKPIFAQKNITFLSMQKMGKNKNMAKFSVADEEGKRFTMILFRDLEQFLGTVEQKYGRKVLQDFIGNRAGVAVKMNVIYYPSINEFRGAQELQFVIQHWN